MSIKQQKKSRPNTNAPQKSNQMQSKHPHITVGELRQHLAFFPDEWTLDFSGLEFYRTKARGECHVQIEFSESIYRAEDGKVTINNP